MKLVLALSYSGRWEILQAVKAIATDAKNGKLDPQELNEAKLENYLQTSGIPDPELLIRTSGELRVSNFLLWQIAYTELFITQTLWPDFRKPQFYAALEEYNRRHRRFGALRSFHASREARR